MKQVSTMGKTTKQVSGMQPSASQNKESEPQVDLFKCAMEDQWRKVVEVCKSHPEFHKAKITEAEDTALHLAVSGGKLDIVRQLVNILGKDASNVLKAKNKRGDTPLHIAASLGNARMCQYMASEDYNLIVEKNEKQETPVYLAARFGHKNVFFYLCLCYEGNHSDICSRDKNGNTILHAAIEGEHFDLAFHIVCKYPDLVNYINRDGSSPLHILAKKTNAFKSGSHLGLFDQILYRCVIVDEVKEEIIGSDIEKYMERSEENGPSFPQNYGTCVHFFRMFWGVVCYAMPGRHVLSDLEQDKTKKGNIDEENLQDESSSQSKSDESTGPAKESSGNTDTGSSGTSGKPEEKEEHREGYLPATFIQFFKFVVKFLMIVLGLGFQRIKKVTIKKQRHTWATQVMNRLIDKASMYRFNTGGQTGSGNHDEIMKVSQDFPRDPSLTTGQDTFTGNVESSSIQPSAKEEESQHGADSERKEGNAAMVERLLGEYSITGTVDSKTVKHALKMKFEKNVADDLKKSKTPILIAASNGITEIVKKILEKFPVAIQDVDSENKNVVLLAVENRQTHTFRFLIEKKFLHESVFRQSDDQGNNALHLAATYGHYRPWLIPGSALQMQWELKWYKFVKKSMEKHLLVHYNNKGQTPKQIFTETHKALVKDGSEWLNKTSESCSLIAALIATVAFATAANIPGGVDDKTGLPVLRDKPAFGVFAISSLVALCFSLTALVFFLAILTSRLEEKDFAKKLPRKLILGLTSLFTSIAAMLVSFCAGHFFELRDKLKFAAFPIYTATCLPISLFALAQLPLYFDLLSAIRTKVPRRGYKEISF